MWDYVGLGTPWTGHHTTGAGGAHVSLVVAAQEVDLGGGQDLEGQDVQDGGRGLGAVMTGAGVPPLSTNPPPPVQPPVWTVFAQSVGRGRTTSWGIDQSVLRSLPFVEFLICTKLEKGLDLALSQKKTTKTMGRLPQKLFARYHFSGAGCGEDVG